MEFEKEIWQYEQKASNENFAHEIHYDFHVQKSIENGRLEISQETIEFKKIIFEDLCMLIPATFEMMSIDNLQIKYPYIHRSDYIFTNNNGTCDISVEILDEVITKDNFKAFSYSLLNTFEKVSPKMDIVKEFFEEEEERLFLSFNFTQQTIENEVKVFMSINYTFGVLSLFSCSCPKKDEKLWDVLSTGMVRTINKAEGKINEK